MKAKKQIKSVALILTILVFFQSCSVYHHSTSTMDQAVQKQKKVMITRTDNSALYFKKIVLKDGNYYGVKKVKDSSKEIQLIEKDIKSIKSKNVVLSTILSILIPIVIVGGISIIAASNTGSLFGSPNQ